MGEIQKKKHQQERSSDEMLITARCVTLTRGGGTTCLFAASLHEQTDSVMCHNRISLSKSLFTSFQMMPGVKHLFLPFVSTKQDTAANVFCLDCPKGRFPD